MISTWEQILSEGDQCEVENGSHWTSVHSPKVFFEDSSREWASGSVSECSSCISIDGKVFREMCCPPRSFQKASGVPFKARGGPIAWSQVLSTTIYCSQKLKRKKQKKVRGKEPADGKVMILDGKVTADSEGEDMDDSVSSASDFVSKERRSKSLRRKGIRGKKPFVPPLPKVREAHRQ